MNMKLVASDVERLCRTVALQNLKVRTLTWNFTISKILKICVKISNIFDFIFKSEVWKAMIRHDQ